MARKRRSKDQPREIDALVECLREFIRLNYMTAAEVARQIGVRDTTIYDWLLGRARPANPDRIAAFLDSLPRHRSNGIQILRIQELARYPQASPLPVLQAGEGRDSGKSRRAFRVCPNCHASGSRRETNAEALPAWNGRG
jgi:hypothetical protein